MENLATKLVELKKNIILIYAFNGTGKTRLSVAYKNETKKRNGGNHSGVYYNAYSEDLFNWDNDEENDGENIRLVIQKSSLNVFHRSLDEEKIRDKLIPYRSNFDFRFNSHNDIEQGFESIQFFLKVHEPVNAIESSHPQKSSEGEGGSDIDETTKEENLKNEKSTVHVETSKQAAASSFNENSVAELISETAVSSTPKELNEIAIKISRGEEQIFIWCFFLALFDIEGWTGEGKQSAHFFIDDPVSSLDDHNIFVTISSLMDLIDQHFKRRKVIVTTHHIGFFSILADWLTRGEKSNKYEDEIEIYKLKRNNEIIELIGPRKEVFLYHLELLQILKEAIDKDKIYVYHFALLRQILENISSFLGAGNFSYVLKEIGFDDEDKKAQLINIMSHKTVFRYELREPVPDNKRDITDIFAAIQKKYNFKLHI